MEEPSLPLNSRRKFIANTVIVAGSMALSVSAVSAADKNSWNDTPKAFPAGLTVQQIIDLILREGKLLPLADTVDTLKSGNADMVVTGIVTTMFATISVIEETAKLGANFIIAHEPTFYNHADDPNWVKNNMVVKQKQELLARHQITVWRFHDYIHRLQPDAVIYGTAKKLGWLPFFKPGEYVYTIPQINLQGLVKHFKTALGIPHVRVVGDLKQQCTRIAVLPGAPGGQRQVLAAETLKPDVLVVGELSEWETAEYMRDQKLLGGKMALIILGHNYSEDPGMWYLVEWLQPKLPGVRIKHIPAGEPFEWM